MRGSAALVLLAAAVLLWLAGVASGQTPTAASSTDRYSYATDRACGSLLNSTARTCGKAGWRCVETSGGPACVDFSCASFTAGRIYTAPASLGSLVAVQFTVQSSCTGGGLSGLSLGQIAAWEGSDDPSPLPSFGAALSGYGYGFLWEVLLLVDASANSAGAAPRLAEASRRFLAAARAGDSLASLAIGTFASGPAVNLLADFSAPSSPSLQIAADRIPSLISNDSALNLYGGVLRGLALLQDRLASSARSSLSRRGLLVVYASQDDGAGWADRAAAVEAARAARVASPAVDVYTVGLYPPRRRRRRGARRGALSAASYPGILSSLGFGGSTVAPDAATLPAAFLEAASAVSANASSTYVLTYCSPKRAPRAVPLSIGLAPASGTGRPPAPPASVALSFNSTLFSPACNAGTDACAVCAAAGWRCPACGLALAPTAPPEAAPASPPHDEAEPLAERSGGGAGGRVARALAPFPASALPRAPPERGEEGEGGYNDVDDDGPTEAEIASLDLRRGSPPRGPAPVAPRDLPPGPSSEEPPSLGLFDDPWGHGAGRNDAYPPPGENGYRGFGVGYDPEHAPVRYPPARRATQLPPLISPNWRPGPRSSPHRLRRSGQWDRERGTGGPRSDPSLARNPYI
eukprot:tig00000404_g381.t1